MIHDKDCCQGREGVDNPADEAVASQDARKPSQKYDADIHRQNLYSQSSMVLPFLRRQFHGDVVVGGAQQTSRTLLPTRNEKSA